MKRKLTLVSIVTRNGRFSTYAMCEHKRDGGAIVPESVFNMLMLKAGVFGRGHCIGIGV